MASSDSVNPRPSTSANTGKAPKYLGRRQFAHPGHAMPYLAQLSNGPGESFTNYRYDSDGSGTFVYVVDSGYNPGVDIFNSHEVMAHRPDHNSDEDGHGTNVAALAVGKYMGAAPEAVLAVMKVTYQIPGPTPYDPPRTHFHTESLADGVLSALDDIVNNQRQKSSVLCLSLRKYIHSCGL